ncbi:MAG: transposase [Acidobacteria bacterium]|nr:transposase [Acidobacteriota bacterium]
MSVYPVRLKEGSKPHNQTRSRWLVVVFAVDNQSRFIQGEGGGDIGLGVRVSNGERVENPKYRAAESELKRARVTRRKNKRSNRRRKAINILARKHLHIKGSVPTFTTRRRLMRVSHHHRSEAWGMVRNHHLAKSISDAGWNQFARILTSKAANAGREVILVNPAYTSQDCSQCQEAEWKSRLRSEADGTPHF